MLVNYDCKLWPFMSAGHLDDMGCIMYANIIGRRRLKGQSFLVTDVH